jgi:hypothetical protein
MVLSAFILAGPTNAQPGQNPNAPGQNQNQQGQNQSQQGQNQNQNQQQNAAATPAAASVEGTLLTYNAIQANAVSIASRINIKLGARKLFIMSQSDAAVILADDLVTAQFKSFDDLGGSLVAKLEDDAKDVAPPTSGTHELFSFPGGTEIITNLASLATMVENGLPQITDTFSNVAADSDTLVYAVAHQLESGHTVYLPGLFPPPMPVPEANGLFAGSDNGLASLISDVSTLHSRIQAAVTKLTPHNPSGSPPPPATDRFKWYDGYTADFTKAQAWLTGYAAFLTTIGTPDATGVTPLAHSVANAFVKQSLLKSPDDTAVLILRAETTTGASRNDKGFFGKWWLLPQPHNDYYYGGVSTADYALFSGDGGLLASGVLRKGSMHIPEGKLDEMFKPQTSVSGDEQEADP